MLKIYPGGRVQRADRGKRHKSIKIGGLSGDNKARKLPEAWRSGYHSVLPGETLIPANMPAKEAPRTP
jgi:hypothetical protein